MADTYELDPAVRVEEILNGDDIEPANRLEYFLKKAATEVPKPTAADAGKVVTVNDDGDGYVLGEGGGDIYIGTYLTLSDAPALPEGYIMAEEYGSLNGGPAPIYVSTDDGELKYSAVYPSMPEAKPAFVMLYRGDGEVSVGVAKTIYEPDPSYYYDPVVEELSANRAYLTLNTAVTTASLVIPTSFIPSNIEGPLTIEKNNLKWILYGPK